MAPLLHGMQSTTSRARWIPDLHLHHREVSSGNITQLESSENAHHGVRAEFVFGHCDSDALNDHHGCSPLIDKTKSITSTDADKTKAVGNIRFEKLEDVKDAGEIKGVRVVPETVWLDGDQTLWNVDMAIPVRLLHAVSVGIFSANRINQQHALPWLRNWARCSIAIDAHQGCEVNL